MIEHHESPASDQVAPPAIDSLFVTAVSRIATPRASLPRSLFAMDVLPDCNVTNGSVSVVTAQIRRPPPSDAPAVRDGDNALVSAVPALARVFDAPMGVLASNSPANTFMTVAVHCSLALGVTLIEPAPHEPVATT